MTGPPKHTNKRYDWMSRVFGGWYLYKVCLIFCCHFAGFTWFSIPSPLGGVGLLLSFIHWHLGRMQL